MQFGGVQLLYQQDPIPGNAVPLNSIRNLAAVNEGSSRHITT
jgi:hypothetical protein